MVLASGVAALSGLFFALLKSGDHVIFSSVTYIAVYRLLNELLNNKFGVETTIVDTSDPENVRKAIRPNTKLIHIETPGNPTLTISDIKAIADIAHENNALLSVDNTFASPYNQRPVELGADFSIESLTKYINGHGDAMGGAIIGKKEYLDIIRAQSQINLGATISPFNAWLIMRGAVTLPLRMKQHNENALKVAKYLKTVKGVSFVAYPGLKDHPNHDIAKKQMTNGFGATSFYMRILRCVYRKAVGEGLALPADPFENVYTGVDKTSKRAATLTDIKHIKQLDLSDHKSLEFARDIFLFSFYMRGMSFIDLAYLRKKDLNSGFVSYSRRKTGKKLIIRWEKQMQEIIDRYGDSETQYLLPIIEREDGTERRQYRNKMLLVNRKLKKIAARAGLTTPLTMYVARHSWASIAKTKNIHAAPI